MERLMTLANGRITCRQCQAQSKRTKQQCRAPAVRGKRVCRTHGGKSTGPTTAEGKQRSAAAHTIHGRERRADRVVRSAQTARIYQLEDLVYLLKMTAAPRFRGRKPLGYVPIKSLAQAWMYAVNNPPHSL